MFGKRRLSSTQRHETFLLVDGIVRGCDENIALRVDFQVNFYQVLAEGARNVCAVEVHASSE